MKNQIGDGRNDMQLVKPAQSGAKNETVNNTMILDDTDSKILQPSPMNFNRKATIMNQDVTDDHMKEAPEDSITDEHQETGTKRVFLDTNRSSQIDTGRNLI